MRLLKRWLRRHNAYRRARPRIDAARPHLAHALGGPVTWRRAGNRGRDVICIVLRDGVPGGVLRVTDPAAPLSAPPAAGLPFRSLAATEKIDREWDAYTLGAPLRLTPAPLWRDATMMLCAHLSAAPLAAAPLASSAFPAIAALHAAGLTHMDMSLSNILYDAATGRHAFIDFEYAPAAHLTFPQQCLYDYLRLFESFWKTLSPGDRAAAARTLLAAHAGLPAAVREADPSPLLPALTRLRAASALAPLFPPAPLNL